MLFITNRSINEPLELQVGRKITFNTANNQTGQAVFFCRRNAAGDYTEVGSTNLLEELRTTPVQQIIVYLHGFNNQPEDDIFPRATNLQDLFDSFQQGLAYVLPVIWPCNNRVGILRDYYDDEDAADASAFAFARLLEKFLAWQEQNSKDGVPSCLKRINVLAHSMGNRVLRGTLERWGQYYRNDQVPLLFRNCFLIAADIDNESLEPGCKGRFIPQISRNVVVYYASDDLALRASKVANDGNVINKFTSRRLGHSGPEHVDRLPKNVYMVDCDDINNTYDNPKGHAYFLRDGKGGPGLVFRHLLRAMQTGRVEVDDPLQRTKILTEA